MATAKRLHYPPEPYTWVTESGANCFTAEGSEARVCHGEKRHPRTGFPQTANI